MTFRSAVAVAALFLAACARQTINHEVFPATAADSSSVSRFGDPTGIIAVRYASIGDPIAAILPKYPPGLEGRKISGASVDAFVIDTTGHIELETITFLNEPRHEFADAVCEYLPTFQYRPFVVDQWKRRILVVQLNAFMGWSSGDSAIVPNAQRLQDRAEADFAVAPITTVINRLAKLPHCEPRHRQTKHSQ